LEVAIRNCIVAGDRVWDLLAAVRPSALQGASCPQATAEEEPEHIGALRVFSDAADMLMHIERLGLPGK
jgi:hypothetical protein